MRLQPSAVWRGLLLSGLFLSCLGTAVAQSSPPRISDVVDNGRRVALKGNVHPLARHEFDRGVEPDSLRMEHMFLVLTKSPEQGIALRKLLAQQQDKSSPKHHQWLTPEQFGERFGLSDSDLEIVDAWLTSQGFRVNRNSASHTLIDFSGDAGLVHAAFHTEIRRFVVNGEEHWANSSDPQIPAALSSVVAGVVGLNNFYTRPMHRVGGVFSRSKTTGRVEPLFTFGSGLCLGSTGGVCFAVGPTDFATIYNVLPLWNAGIDGTGQTIAVVGRSNVNLQDIRDFRSLFGLPPRDPTVINPPGNSDPGPTGDSDETEADLDVEWSGAVAKNASINLVTAASSATDGALISAMYVVDTNLVPVMSVSFGECELFLGSSGNQFFNGLWQQAAAQGMTVLVAAGDSGSAACDPSGSEAAFGLAVSGIASTPFNTAVGGTDFDDFENQAKFWSANNNSTTQASAKGYIPEVPWNDSCTNPELFSLFGSASAEANCNNAAAQFLFLAVSGGGGGVSNCTSSAGPDPSTCFGGYAKPPYQLGLGSNDGKRDLPDLSLFAATGLVSASFYIICQADQTPNDSCNLDSPFTNFIGIGGTSAASPTFAGIMALVNQKKGSIQGNANPVLYSLAAQQSESACNSSLGPASTCIFNDVTSGTNAMPCVNPSPDCNVSNPADLVGILSGFNATAGYDLATGLGSVNATNLVNNWTSAGVFGQFSVSSNPGSFDFAAGKSGTSTVTVTGTNGFTGVVNFTCSVSPVPVNDPPTCFVLPLSVTLNAKTASDTTSLEISTKAGLSSAS